MLKTIIIVVLIAGAILASIAICAYVLKVDFAANIMNEITQPFSSLMSGGNLDLPTIASGASIATAATTAIGWMKSNKDKAIAMKASAEKTLQNSGLLEEIETIKTSKTQLEGQITELTQLKDDALAEAIASKDQIAKVTQENKNLQSSIDTLNALVPRIQKEKEIIQVVK